MRSTHTPRGDSNDSTLSNPSSALISDQQTLNSTLVKASIQSNVRASVSTDAFEDIKELLNTLHSADIPGPWLIRMRPESEEFCEKVKGGGQGTVYTGSQSYRDRLALCLHHSDPTLVEAAQYWRSCVVKQPRSDKGRTLKTQANLVLGEVQRLCDPRLKSEFVVRLAGWALDLDTLERGTPQLPLLVLKKARCDLAVFIADDRESKHLGYGTWRDLASQIGRGIAAIHRAGICHGDIKPDNILILQPDSDISTTHKRLRDRWSAKICDFASAQEATVAASTENYLGTVTWQPPEKLGPVMIMDLKLCDIFTYGLVVWSMFTSNPKSPIESMSPDDIREAVGSQQFFSKARIEITKQHPDPRRLLFTPSSESSLESGGRPWFPLTVNQLHFTSKTSSFMRWCGSFFQAFVNSTSQENSVKRNQIGAFPAAPLTGDYGTSANRILNVLASSLNDDPDRRDRQPWDYFRDERVHSVRIPVSFKRPEGPITKTSHRSRIFVHAVKKLLEIKAQYVKPRLTIHAMSLAISYHLKAWLPILRPRGSRQRVFEDFHSAFSDIIGLNPDDIALCFHQDEEPCFTLSASKGRKLRNRISENLNSKDLNNLLTTDALYSLARLRNRFQPFCWANILASVPHRRRYASVLWIVGSALTLVEKQNCDEILAWAMRDKTVEDFKDENILPFFDFLMVSWTSDDERTFRMLVLVETHFFLGQVIKLGQESHSVFQHYLARLQDETQALQLCQHFHRIASLDGATPGSKLFYVGSLAGPNSDITESLTEELLGLMWTTSLHDAVRVGNYPVVEYLVRSGFVVTARDSDNKTATDIALELATPRSKRAYREILDFLSQHPSNSRLKLELPLGWDRFEVENGLSGFRETSIDHVVHPLTFQKPRASLLQDRKLVIAERQVKGFDNQTYTLNPIRFLATAKNADSVQIARAKVFTDQWFREEIDRTRRPPPLPASQDERWWFRYTARFLIAIRPYILSLFDFSNANFLFPFVPLCLIGRLMSWDEQVVLSFCVLALNFLHLKSSYHLNAFCVHRISETTKDYLITLTTCIPELWIGALAVFQGDVRFPLAVFFGSVTSIQLLVVGASMVIAGFYHRLSHFNEHTSLFSSMNLVGPVSTTLLYAFYSSITVADPAAVMAGIITLSRGIAIFSLIMSFLYFLFRSWTHSDLFESWDDDLDDLGHSDHDEDVKDDSLTSWLHLAYFFLFVILLIGVSDTLYRSIDSKSLRGKALTGLFLLPLTAKVWLAGQNFREAILSGRRGGSAIDKASLPPLHMSLVVAPCWVLTGWAIGKPMTLLLDLPSTAMYGIAFCISSLKRDRESHYLTGLKLVLVYLIISLASILYVKSEEWPEIKL